MDFHRPMTVKDISLLNRIEPMKCQVIGEIRSHGLQFFLTDLNSSEQIELKVNKLHDIPCITGSQAFRIFGLIEYENGSVNVSDKLSSVESKMVSIQDEIPLHNKPIPFINVEIMQSIPPSLLFKLIEITKSIQILNNEKENRNTHIY